MPAESTACFGLFNSGVWRGMSIWGEGGMEGLDIVLYVVKMYLVCDWMLKKKLQPLMIELVVILNHLGALHL